MRVWAKIPPSEMLRALQEHLRRNYGRKIPPSGVVMRWNGECFTLEIPEGTWDG